MAFKSIQRYLKELLHLHSNLGSSLSGKDAALLAKNSNNSTNSHTEIFRPYERVQFDGHMIDALFSVVSYTPQGDKIVTLMNRLWLLAIIDVASRAILGYHISYNSHNYSANDVITCFKKTLMPWEPKNLKIPTLKYNAEDGFPSYFIEKAKFGVWDEICFDNAKAHSANIVLDSLQGLNCAVNFGPVANPTLRGIIERFFGTLEHNNFHRLPSTVGSNVLDPKRDNAEEKAVAYEITVDN